MCWCFIYYCHCLCLSRFCFSCFSRRSQATNACHHNPHSAPLLSHSARLSHVLNPRHYTKMNNNRLKTAGFSRKLITRSIHRALHQVRRRCRPAEWLLQGDTNPEQPLVHLIACPLYWQSNELSAKPLSYGRHGELLKLSCRYMFVLGVTGCDTVQSDWYTIQVCAA